GWVRNLRKGQVEVVAEGDERAWQSFLDQLRSGHLGRNIEKLEVAEEVSGEALEGFEIRFS
ncbi:MAG TPA: acylphosphatase, partial [bacterium]|nr:acylphosphatase [bacterium]